MEERTSFLNLLPKVDRLFGEKKIDIFVVSDIKELTKIVVKNCELVEELIGFGKEIHRLEHFHNFRLDPSTMKMVHLDQAPAGASTLTKPDAYEIKIK
ncbi:MAG: hypothetical protein H6581_14715 [Bacteroidia bacterium]|nr:hypothetical protein [Bacteroidia bacterium]